MKLIYLLPKIINREAIRRPDASRLSAVQCTLLTGRADAVTAVENLGVPMLALLRLKSSGADGPLIAAAIDDQVGEVGAGLILGPIQRAFLHELLPDILYPRGNLVIDRVGTREREKRHKLVS